MEVITDSKFITYYWPEQDNVKYQKRYREVLEPDLDCIGVAPNEAVDSTL